MKEIQSRIDDALFLWQNGRRDGALLVALVAVAASARRRYPNLKDREAFEQFLHDCHSVRLNVEYRGTCEPIEHIFYKWFRCQLVHEGGLPIDIEFMDTDEMAVRAGGAPEYVLKVGRGWFHHLIRSATQGLKP